MTAADDFGSVVHALYEAALEPHRLQDALHAARRYVGADNFHLVGRDAVTRQVCLSLPANDSLVVANERYTADGTERDPHHSVEACLYRDAKIDIQLGFQKQADQPCFSETQVVRLTILLPHLQRVVVLVQRNDAAQAALEAKDHALNALDHGVIALDNEAGIVFANHRAQAILRMELGLRNKDGCLDVCGPAGRPIEPVLKRVAASGQSESVTLRDEGGKLMHVVTVSRIPLEGAPAWGWRHTVHRRAILLIAINTPGGQRVVTAHQLVQLFGLTPAEARLAHAMAQGHSMDSYQVLQGLKESTVRTQLQSVLRKTGTCRQTDLLRLLACIASAR